MKGKFKMHATIAIVSVILVLAAYACNPYGADGLRPTASGSAHSLAGKLDRFSAGQRLCNEDNEDDISSEDDDDLADGNEDNSDEGE